MINSNHNCSDIVNKAREKMPPDELIYHLSELFKICGDFTRVKILYTLFDNELCVGDIAELLNMSGSAISHQLRILKQAMLVKFKREGKTILYSLADAHVKTIFNQGMEHILE